MRGRGAIAMHRALLISALLLIALVPSAAAASGVPDVIRCDGSGVCIVLSSSDHETCAGAGVGLQGAVVCVRPMDLCVLVRVGFQDTVLCPVSLS